MKLQMLTLATAAALAAAAGGPALAADDVVIGDIDDMSGVYADVMGAAGVEVVKWAAADFGGTVLGRKITVLSADHQNKPDIGASKFREWADQNGLNLLLGGSNTGVNIAMAKVGLVLMIGGEDLDRLPKDGPAEVCDRHFDRLDAACAENVGVGPRHVVDVADHHLVRGGVGCAGGEKRAERSGQKESPLCVHQVSSRISSRPKASIIPSRCGHNAY